MISEEYKPIVGWDKFYSVSNLGNIKNITTNKTLKPFISNGYYLVKLANPKKQLRVHRLVAKAFVSNPNMLGIVDHADNDKLNNNSNNLRWCTPAQNRYNSKGYGKSKYIGVSEHTSKNKYFKKKTKEEVVYTSTRWLAHIKVGDKYMHLGRFINEEDAAQAYDNAAIIHHGEFANLNF